MPTEQSSEEQTTIAPGSIIVTPDEGKILEAFGDTVQVKISGQQTNGAMVVLLDTTPPAAARRLTFITMRTNCSLLWRGVTVFW